MAASIESIDALSVLKTPLPDNGQVVTVQEQDEADETHALRHRARWRKASGWYARRHFRLALERVA